MKSVPMNRRRFLSMFGMGSAAVALAACSRRSVGNNAAVQAASPEIAQLAATLEGTTPNNGSYTLPPLPYAYNALEPSIDEPTMVIHHDRHHQGYVDKLNEALADYPDLQGQNAAVLLVNLETLPEAIRTPVRRHGGGHVNHSMFWQVMSPDGGGEPGGTLAEAINATFGDFAAFREEMSSAAANRFGSGWGWLAATPEGQLVTLNTPNQDSPYLGGFIPLLGIDVWEHAYYLKYQNRRGEYIDAWWNTVNWPAVEQRFATLTS